MRITGNAHALSRNRGLREHAYATQVPTLGASCPGALATPGRLNRGDFWPSHFAPGLTRNLVSCVCNNSIIRLSMTMSSYYFNCIKVPPS